MAQRMAEELPPNRYPWSDWQEGTWSLTAGDDYTCSTEQMRHNIYVRALRAGLAATTKTTEDGLMLRFKPKEETAT